MKAQRSISAVLSYALLFSIVGCEEAQQAPAKKPLVSAADSKSCEDFSITECPTNRCYKYASASYSTERCNSSPQTCSTLPATSCSTGLNGSCTYLSGLQRCIEKSYDSCDARQSAADCTVTYSGTKCMFVGSVCSNKTECSNVATTSCTTVPGCNTAQTAQGTICTTAENAFTLNEQYKKSTNPNTTGSMISTLLPAVLPGLLGIIQTFIAGNIAKNNPNAQVNIGLPSSTTPAAQAGTSAPASLSLDTFAPLFAQLGIRSSNPSSCDSISDPASCDIKYPECGWLRDTCKSLRDLSSSEVCRGVGINDAGELEASSTTARDRCTTYNRHCTLSSDGVACNAK